MGEIEIWKRGSLHGCGHCAVGIALAERNRRSAVFVARGNDAAVDHDEQGTGPVNGVHRVFDPLDDAGFLVDERGDHFRRVEFSVAHFREVGIAAPERTVRQRFDVVDLTYCDDGVSAEAGGDDQGLILEIADDADSAFSVELAEHAVELCAELCVGDVMNAPGNVAVAGSDGHAAALGSQVGMVIRPVKKFGNTVRGGDNAEKTAHNYTRK